MKHILLIATGGTIACRESGRGLAPSLTGEELLEFLPEIRKICRVFVDNPFSVDSTDITTSQRRELAMMIWENYDRYDGFVIAHGTDSLAYTAALLYHMLRNFNKPVIITGAQRPMGEPGSDAERNMLDSFRVACAGWTGVAAVLHGQVIRGNHVVKVAFQGHECVPFDQRPARGHHPRRRQGAAEHPAPSGRRAGICRHRRFQFCCAQAGPRPRPLDY